MTVGKTYTYVCTPNGHVIWSSKPETACRGYVRGIPCKGTLMRIGTGAREKAGAK